MLRSRAPRGAQAHAQPHPTALLFPVHCDHKRIRLHAERGEAVGIPPERILRDANGVSLEIDANGARLTEREQAGMVDGSAPAPEQRPQRWAAGLPWMHRDAKDA